MNIIQFQLQRMIRVGIALCVYIVMFALPTIAVRADDDVVDPRIIAIERFDPADASTPDKGPYSVGPISYRVNFSEPVTGVVPGSFYVLIRDGCLSGCANITAVDSYPVAGNSESDVFIVTLDNLSSVGTVSVKPSVASGIVDLSGNALDLSSADDLFNVPNALVDYVIDTEPIRFESFTIDGSTMHLFFNKSIEAGANIPLPDLGQFQFSIPSTSQALTPVSISRSGNELIIEFGSGLPNTESMFIYFADTAQNELKSPSGVSTQSFSVEVQPGGLDYVFCSPRVGQPGSSCNSSSQPDTPVIAAANFINPSGVYGVGSEIIIELTTSEDVFLSHDFDVQLLLNVGPINGTGAARFDLGKTLTTPEALASRITNKIILTYIVQENDINPDFDRASGVLEFVAGNAEDIDDAIVHSLDVSTLPPPGAENSLSDGSDIVIDGSTSGEPGFPLVAPTSVSIAPGSGTYSLGSSFTIFVTFDGPVTVTGSPFIQLNSGEDARAEYDPSQSTPTVLAFVYTVGSGNQSSSLDYAFNTALQLNGGSIIVAGDPRLIPVSLTLPSVDGANSLSDLYTIVIVDSEISDEPLIPVSLTGILPALGSYISGSDIVISGNDSSQAGRTVRIYNSDMTDILCSALIAPNGQWQCSIEDLSDGLQQYSVVVFDAVLGMSVPVTYTIAVDTIAPAPVVSSSILPQANTVITDSTPTLSVTIPAEEGGSIMIYEQDVLLCEATILPGGDWSCSLAVPLSEGAHSLVLVVRDRAGNESAPTQWNILIDSVAPAVVSITTPLSSGTYRVGDIIPIDITFSEQIYLLGEMRLKLETGVTDRYAVFSSTVVTTVTNPLRLQYTVMPGDSTSKLDYVDVSSLEIVSGTIRDTAKNNANLILPTPGSVGSLGGAGKPVIVVDTASVALDRNKISPLPGQIVYTGLRPISGSVGSAPKGSIIEIYYGSLKLCRTTVKADGSWLCSSVPMLVPGTHTFKVVSIVGNAKTYTNVVITVKSSTPIKYCPDAKSVWKIGSRGNDILALKLFLNGFVGSKLTINDFFDGELYNLLRNIVTSDNYPPIKHCFLWWKG